MKLLYILHSTNMGGATLSFLSMIKGLQELGITAIVAIPAYKKVNPLFKKEMENAKLHYEKVYLCQSVSVESSGINKLVSVGKRLLLPLRKKYSQLCLKCLIKKINPDIIHTNTGVIHEGYMVARKMGIPHVWHLREYQDLDFRLKIYPSFDLFCEQLKHSFTISITKGINEHFRLEHCKNAKIIYNGIFGKEQTVYLPKEKYFLCASRISPEKGISDVILAFIEFQKTHNDYKLLIIGSGDKKYVETLKHIIANSSCKNSVQFIGFVENVIPYMAKAKALIVASYNEGFGRMTAESCFCGSIVIGRNTAGTKEILEQTGGLLFDNTAEMEKAMQMIVEMPEAKYMERALHAQYMAVQTFSIENNVSQIYSLYTHILAKNI